jgi:hypothetical protein
METSPASPSPLGRLTQREFGEAVMLDANNAVLLLNDIETARWAADKRETLRDLLARVLGRVSAPA